MHSKSDNIEIMINDEADEIIKEISGSLKDKYQNNLESTKVWNQQKFERIMYRFSWLDEKKKKATRNPIS